MSRYGRGCDECQRCTECGAIAYCLSEPGTRPCDHDLTLCGECNIAECPACRREAELEMYTTGEYSAASDPLLNHKAPAWVEPVNPYFDATTNSYRFPRSTA